MTTAKRLHYSYEEYLQLLVEVTSRSTEDYDRGDKLSNYKQCWPSRA